VELGPDSESKRPNVQMGDPFLEKLLIEATLEALATGFVVGIQDMGAAGLTCSTCETAAKGSNGMEIDVRRVPLREANMTPYEIMLSESQERMLCIAQRGTEHRVMDIFKKWGLNAAVIGHVTEDGLVRVKDKGEVVAEVPPKPSPISVPPTTSKPQNPHTSKKSRHSIFLLSRNRVTACATRLTVLEWNMIGAPDSLMAMSCRCCSTRPASPARRG